jgi:hypothetical protein
LDPETEIGVLRGFVIATITTTSYLQNAARDASDGSGYRGSCLVDRGNRGAAMSMKPDPDPTESRQFGIVGLLLAASAVAGILYALARFFK